MREPALGDAARRTALWSRRYEEARAFDPGFAASAERLGLPPDLPRRVSASFLLARGMPVKAIAERLGHSQITVTLNTYAHLAAELQGQAAEAMSRVIGPRTALPS